MSWLGPLGWKEEEGGGVQETLSGSGARTKDEGPKRTRREGKGGLRG